MFSQISRKIAGSKAAGILKKTNGMELVQVAILIALAIVVGLLFKSKIVDFVEEIFSHLSSGKFI